MNPYVKLIRAGAVYPLDPDAPLQAQLCTALIHHVRKHGEAGVIVVNPQVLRGQTGDLVIESRDNGAVYKATVIAENSIGRKRMLIS